MEIESYFYTLEVVNGVGKSNHPVLNQETPEIPERCSRPRLDRVSLPDLPFRDGRICIVKSGELDDVVTGRANGKR